MTSLVILFMRYPDLTVIILNLNDTNIPSSIHYDTVMRMRFRFNLDPESGLSSIRIRIEGSNKDPRDPDAHTSKKENKTPLKTI